LEEVAEFLRVHHSTIYRLIKKRSIPAFKIGSDWRFHQESIERWIKDREAVDSLDHPDQCDTRHNSDNAVIATKSSRSAIARAASRPGVGTWDV
jgi:excisionase family DNA binding protein